jgi:diguanylate cyclase (GGDEF)-like protein
MAFRFPAFNPMRPLRWRPTAASLAIIGFGLTLVSVVWGAGWQQLRDTHIMMQRDLTLEPGNLAVAFEQNVVRTVSELDRILIFLRQARARAGDGTTWQTLIKEPYTIAEQTVQIAVVDRMGRMITSTAMLHQKTPIDIGDREHFRFHARSSGDVLFISRPVLDRASGKRSIQLARRLSAPDGAFDGLIVVSLDPTYVTRTYSKLNLGSSGGLTLVGHDGILRAGTGRFEADIGNGYREGVFLDRLEAGTPDTRIELQLFPDGQKIVATRGVTGLPLDVVVVTDDVEATAAWSEARRSFILRSFAITFLVLLVMWAAVRWQQQAELQLLRVARHDSLTGLANRLSFHNRLEQAVKSASCDKWTGLHLIDLDGFKGVNDTYGHPTGDKLLAAVSQRLLAGRRKSDLVARLGGDEFAIIQHDVRDPSEAEALAGRVCESLRQPFEIDGITLEIAASVGVAFADRDASTPVDLVKAADTALYRSKADGGRTYRIYCASMTEASREQRELEKDLTRALEQDELELHYQPIVDLPSQSLRGFEALLRWHDCKRGFRASRGLRPGRGAVRIDRKARQVGHHARLQGSCRMELTSHGGGQLLADPVQPRDAHEHHRPGPRRVEA